MIHQDLEGWPTHLRKKKILMLQMFSSIQTWSTRGKLSDVGQALDCSFAVINMMKTSLFFLAFWSGREVESGCCCWLHAEPVHSWLINITVCRPWRFARRRSRWKWKPGNLLGRSSSRPSLMSCSPQSRRLASCECPDESRLEAAGAVLLGDSWWRGEEIRQRDGV